MLKITVPAVDMFDEKTQTFQTLDEQTLLLEHSLISISKWESKWCRSFLSSKQRMTDEETLYYIQCMTVNKNVDPNVYKCLTRSNINDINTYISAPMTATTFNNTNNKASNQIVTAELIYFWMISFNIPMECQKWHINRLLTLIRVCENKNAPAKKMGKGDVMRQYASLNASRRQKFNSKG